MKLKTTSRLSPYHPTALTLEYGLLYHSKLIQLYNTTNPNHPILKALEWEAPILITWREILKAFFERGVVIYGPDYARLADENRVSLALIYLQQQGWA